MSGLELRIDASDLQRLRRLVGEEVYRTGTRSALNKLLSRAKTQISREVRAEYSVKARDVSKTIRTRRASGRDLEARLFAMGPRIPLMAFGAKQKRRGVTVRVKKASGRKLIKHAFIAKMSSGHIGVFWRKGKARLPIQERFGPAIPQMMRSDKVLRGLFDRLNREAPEILAHEIEFAAEKASAKRRR